VCSSDSRARGIGTRHTFGGGIVVRSSERHTVVQEDATICHIQWCAPADGFRDIASWETVVESRAVIHVRRSVRLPGKGRIEAQVQRVPLIAVDGANIRTADTARMFPKPGVSRAAPNSALSILKPGLPPHL
jgi:hypothetical protein